MKRKRFGGGSLGWMTLAVAFHAGVWAVMAQPAEPTPGPARVKEFAAGTAAQGEPAESGAERVSRLRRKIDEGEGRLQSLRSALQDPDSEYARAESEFGKLDGIRQAKRKDLDKPRTTLSPEELTALQAALDEVEPQWKLAKERFDLAIAERKTLAEQISAIEQSLEQDRQALAKIVTPTPAAGSPVPVASPESAENPSGSPNGQAVAPVSTSAPPPLTDSSPSPPAAPPGPAVPTTGGPPLVVTPSTPPPSTGSSTGLTEGTAPPGASESPSKSVRKEVVEAKEEVQKKESKAQEAEAEVRSITERIEAVRKNIELERKLLQTARLKSGNAQETQRTLTEQAQKRWREGANQDELNELWSKANAASQRFYEARDEVTSRVDRLDALQEDLERLQSEQIVALQQADEERRSAEAARSKLEELQNPFSIQNMLRWLLERGPRIVLILAGMVGLVGLARALDARLVKIIAIRGEHGSWEERENRARTLVSVFHSTATVAIIVGGCLMLLAELGVNIVPLMGGAAVVGLAVAFGAQNLVRDFFSGFMILLEHQYTINDVVQIGTISGQVERITLRLTILRDLQGVVHFVPNGQITTVSNMTHGWSRALFDIGVAYKEDVDRVISVLLELGKDLRRDPDYRHMILESPEMLGVDALGDSAVIIKFFIKTRPLKQWIVKRELLRRIKNRFDELGIEIPFPHRTVYHHQVPDVPSSNDPARTSRPSEIGADSYLAPKG